MLSIMNNLQQLTIDQSLTQQDLADLLNISRPTVAKLIDNPDLMSVQMLKILADKCNVSIDYLMGRSKLPEPTFSAPSCELPEPEMRDNIPHNSKIKFENALLYILAKIGAKPNIGQTILYKLFYFLDFDYYEKYEEQLIGLTYIRNHFGPTPKYFKTFVDQMITDQKLEEIKTKHFRNDQTKYLPRVDANMNCFNPLEIAHIDWEIDRFKDMSAVEASELSHQDLPWITSKQGEILEYESVFYRDTRTSQRVYEDDQD